VATTLHDQLLDAYRAAFSAWLDAVDGLDGEAWGTPTGCPGWDVHDQLAHVVSLERLMLGDLWPDAEVPPELAHVRNDFGRFVEVGVHVRRPVPHDALVQEARDTFERRLVALEHLDPASLAEEMDGPGGMRMRGSQLLRTRLFDTVTHEHDVRRALARPRPPAAHDRIAAEQVLRAWARRVAAGEGDGLLLVHVDGVVTAVLDLGSGAFDTREPADASAGPPDGSTVVLHLHLDVSELLALGGGRVDAPSADDLERRGALVGDLQVGRELVASASVTP
jgi:uncharacterized protein (TIGR03083 family)